MAATAASVTTTAEIHATQKRLTRFIHSNFHRRLSVEDARDAAADALIELDRALARNTEIHNPDGWLRRAAWRNALDQIRSIEGEAAVPRDRPVDIADFTEFLPETREEDPSETAGREVDVEALAKTWSQLKPDEQRAIHLRYYDELPVDEVLRILGCSRHHYENLTKRALRKLREALVQTVADSGCRACRALTLQAQDQPLLPRAVLERDAHLAGCLPCRAFARRQAGLMAALPLPVVGFADRITAYWGARFGNAPELAQSSEVIAAGTVGGGTAATGLLGTAGGAAKIAAVVCAGSAVTAAVCVPNIPKPKLERPPAARVAKAKPNPRPARAASLKTAPAIAAAAQVARPTTAQAETPKLGSATDKPKQRSPKPEPRAPEREASPFLPESAADPQPTTPDTPSAATAATTQKPDPVATTSAPATEPASADFSQEFTP